MFCSFFDLVLEYIVKILFPWSYLGYCSCSSPSPPLSVVSSFICNSHLLACIRFWVPVTLWSIYFSSIKSELYTKRWKSVPSSCPSHPIPIFFSPCIRLLPVGNPFVSGSSFRCVHVCFIQMSRYSYTCLFPLLSSMKGRIPQVSVYALVFHLAVYSSLQKRVTIAGPAVILRNACLQG